MDVFGVLTSTILWPGVRSPNKHVCPSGAVLEGKFGQLLDGTYTYTFGLSRCWCRWGEAARRDVLRFVCYLCKLMLGDAKWRGKKQGMTGFHTKWWVKQQLIVRLSIGQHCMFSTWWASRHPCHINRKRCPTRNLKRLASEGMEFHKVQNRGKKNQVEW